MTNSQDTTDTTDGQTTATTPAAGLKTASEHGLQLTAQLPAESAARVDAGEYSPSGVWHEIATSDAFQRELVESVRELLAGTHRNDWASALRDVGVVARDGRYATLVAWLDRAPEADAHQDALDYTAALGQGTVTVYGTRCTLDEALDGDLVDGPLALLDAAERAPTIPIRIGTAFRERPREQRENTLSLLGTLGTVCDIRIVAGRLTARWLGKKHRSQLPADFTDSLDARHDQGPPRAESVDAALEELDPDGRAVNTLRLLAEEPGQTLPQRSLVASQSVGEATISQVLDELEALHLAERYSAGRENRVELCSAGIEFLDRLDDEIGKQAELDRLFGETGHSDDRPCNHAQKTSPPEGEAAQPQTAPYRTRFLRRADHAAAAGTAIAGGVTAVSASVSEACGAEHQHTRFVSYNSDRDEAVVAVRATTPLQYVTSVALSLASPRLFDQALPTHRLDKLDVSPELLRGARCIGGLSSEAEDDPEVLRDKLVEWGENLASMTTDLHRNTCEDRDAFRGEIMRSAHGLAGTIAHLLDVAGVDLVREFRLPSSHTHTRLADLAETVSTAITIQSRYGHYAAYRQLYEHRDDKRTSALSPTVDAADPFGEYIGSLVLRGPKAHQLAHHVHGHLSAPAAVHDDAPEVGVRVPIGTPDRTAYAQTVSRMCSWKNLSTTREAVTLYQTLAGSPYAVADAIHHLSPGTMSRQIRLDEVRITLSHLDHQRLLPDAAPSVSKAIAGLLRTDRALTQAELAEEAGVSPRSLRRHLDVLVALDLVRDTDAGYRLSLPFATNKERGRQITPETVGSSTAAPRDLLFDVVMALVENTGRLSDPDDPLSTVFVWPPDYEELRRLLPDVDPWVHIAKTLCGEPDPPSETVSFGMEPQQTSLQDCSGGEPA